MNKRHEFEKKILLTYQEYIYLLNKFGKKEAPNKQINFYYDNDDLIMHKSGITCRNRLKNNKYIATIKKHSQTDKDKSIEISDTSSNEKYPKNFKNMGLKLQGQLTTFRTVLINTDHLKVVLDHNQYLGTQDYELEIEYDKPHENEAIALIEEIAISLFYAIIIPNPFSFVYRQEQVFSKSQRFFMRLCSQGSNQK